MMEASQQGLTLQSPQLVTLLGSSLNSNEEESEIKTNSPTLLDWLDLDPPFENCTEPRSPIESGFTSNGVYLSSYLH